MSHQSFRAPRPGHSFINDLTSVFIFHWVCGIFYKEGRITRTAFEIEHFVTNACMKLIKAMLVKT